MSEESEKKRDKTKIPWWFWVIILPGTFGLWLFIPWLALEHYSRWTENSGILGDTFGAVNALFTGLAFAFLILTIYLQKKDLQHQLEEFKHSVDALEGQQQQMIIQNEQNYFFKLLDSLTNSINCIEFEKNVKEGRIRVHGLAAVDEIILAYLQNFESAMRMKVNREPRPLEWAEIAYTNMRRMNASGIELFINHLSNAIQFIKKSSEENACDFANTLIANVTMETRIMVFDYLISKPGPRTGGVFGEFRLFHKLNTEIIPKELHQYLPADPYGSIKIPPRETVI